MLRQEQSQAAVSVIVPKFGDRENDGALVDGLKVKNSRASAPCAIVRRRAMLCASVRKNGCRGRSLLVSNRRIVATSRFTRGVSFGGNRNHGIFAPAFMGVLHPQILTGGRTGGLMAYRFLLRGNSYPVRPALPVGKGVQLKKVAIGALAMMRTLSRNVSTAFPSIPEPTFLPVQSCHKRVEERPQVNTFADVADGAESLFQRAQAAYREAAFLPSAAARAELRARVSDYLAELISFCREVESLPAGQNPMEARHG